MAAVILGWIPEGKYRFDHSVLLCSSSVATAFIASLLQGKGGYFVQLFIFLWMQNVSYVAIPLKFKSNKVEYI